MFVGVPLCCTTSEISRESFRYEGSKLVIDLAKVAELRAAGSSRAVVDVSRKLNIIVIHVDKQRYVALDRSCTHGGAQCTYNQKRRSIQCTSLNHAEYDLQGTLLYGRTHGNLRVYDVKPAGTRLEISLEKKT